MRIQFLLCATALLFLLQGFLKIDSTAGKRGNLLSANSAAYARSSGGSARSGRWSKPSAKPTRTPVATPSRTPTDSRPTKSPSPPRYTPSPATTRPSVPVAKPTRTPVATPSLSPTYSRPTQSPRPPLYTPSPTTTRLSVPVATPSLSPRYSRPTQSPSPPPYTPSPATTHPNPSSRGGIHSVPVPELVPVPYYPPAEPPIHSSSRNSASSSGFFGGFWLFMLLSGGTFLIVPFLALRNKIFNRDRDSQTTSPLSPETLPDSTASARLEQNDSSYNQNNEELNNEIFTVSKLQVALLSSARHIQQHLSSLAVSADLETPEGRAEFLQECALALRRYPEYWSHVLAHSQTVRSRAQARQIFERLSVEERSKFSAETLSNIRGHIRRQAPVPPSPDEGPAAYIAVTFLVGTADDKPLFGSIHSPEELQQALLVLASIDPDYLLVFELLWSPQEETDSLTYDELLTEYTDIIQIA